MSHGTFSLESPQTEWAVGERPDRTMTTLRDFWFEDPDKVRWDAPASTRTDGASIPRPFWTLVGSPFTGNYRRAAIVHDVACVRAGNDHTKRRAADRMFYHGCRSGGCSIRDSIILYVGVRIGAWIGFAPQWAVSRSSDDSGPRLDLSPSERRLQRDFQIIAEMVLQAGETDDPLEIERRTDEAASRVTGVDLRGR